VYRHWPRIDDLLADAIETRLGVTPPPTTGDPLEDLRAMLVAIVSGVFDDEGAVFFSTLLVQGSESPQLAAVRREIIGRRIGTLRALIERGIAEGAIDPDLDPEHGVSFLTGPIMHRRVVLGRSVTPDFVGDLVARITAPPPTRSTSSRGRRAPGAGATRTR
jgi:AcrR family transcriptional regulator